VTRATRKPDPEPPLVVSSSEVLELGASRARLVAETYAERRKIERDLHDGVQQHLVALAVNLQFARQLAKTDPPALAPVLEEIASDVREALEGVRELAHEIYPPLLLDRGLLDAIGAAASAAAIPTRVEPASLARYPDDLEATVYFCCVDALRGWASGTVEGATVRIWQDGPSLNFEVVYDGEDLDPHDVLPVSRVNSMQDRIGAVGGRLSVTASLASGTRVSGTIPLGP
jgi:signal transduction histidine kinase